MASHPHRGGRIRPGEDPLPSEKDLVDLFGVARDTARRAVQVLRDEGLVETIPHRGTYVLPRMGGGARYQAVSRAVRIWRASV